MRRHKGRTATQTSPYVRKWVDAGNQLPPGSGLGRPLVPPRRWIELADCAIAIKCNCRGAQQGDYKR